MEIIKENRRKIENIFAICILTVFMGQIYITPYAYGFRLSLAVLILSLFLLYFKDYNEILICILVGFLMFIFRSLITFLSYGNHSFIGTILIYLPVISFYVSFGILFKLLEVRNKINNPINFMLSLWVCDSFSNLVEAFIRKIWTLGNFDKTVILIIMMGCIRTIITYMVFWMSNYYVRRFKNDQREKQLKELVLFTSHLKTELFFLNKSRNDIENTVSLIHDYYHNVKSPDLKAILLKVAKEIHEVKKDYLRVIAGMEAAFNKEDPLNYMSNKDILYIIKDNMLKIAAKHNKQIDLSIYYDTIFTTKEFYQLISIINNLAINSIEAIDKFGKIKIDCYNDNNIVKFIVWDNGEGIRKDKLLDIFDAGYSSKYDKITGKMSSGVGLTHVKHIVENYFNGSIEVESEINKYTKFIVKIPYSKLVGGQK
ncbi:sensor histidine kinase [Paramaledivibacter caminithermalis]|uniref:Two-component system, sensor histidine kinase YcbA n=1 Tax=Paramaledivibacter caminithermalis (strain DSM 15212 / CIP 107654 / DViRD3) TaxID=1121301 RepID=A0A1M6QIQ6_PARC5|nr:sensor histidine kinase [Paramaledivibacter caminithermalis]SHK20159.1 two-component system, sensor histidine kinase YcbA [Paramaledivibacter caminithermalis DSM 15212]